MQLIGLSLILTVSLVFSGDPLLIQTKLGPVRGHTKTAFYGTIYRAFEGIPYAQPPVGELRFQPPLPVSPWQDVINATSPSEKCIQCQPAFRQTAVVSGSEDCLYLNIYTPMLGTNDTPFPVIFYVHGGLFMFGDGYEFGPGYLLDRKVIMVSFNYRVGPFGWLSTEDDVIPGNMALKDQSTALRWISENIAAFDGDPDRITMAGHSSGAINAHHQFLSPWNKGLFQRGFTLSNSALSSVGVVEGALDKAKKVASLVGCSTENTTIMASCLMSANATEIVATAPHLLAFGSEPFPYGAVVEKGGDKPFMNASPIEIISRGEAADVPWITGVVSDEALSMTLAYALDETRMSYIRDNWGTLAPYILDFNYTIPKDNQSYVANLIKEHYLGSDAISPKKFRAYTDIVSDRMIKSSTARAAKAHAKANKSPVYFYYFSYRGAHSVLECYGVKENYGVAHCDDMAYIYEFASVNTSTTAKDLEMREFMLDLWVSFAANGTPSVGIDWPQVNSSMEELQYLHIMGPHNVGVETSADFAQQRFWSSIKFNEDFLQIV